MAGQEKRTMTHPNRLDTYVDLLELFISAAHVLTDVDTETTKLEPAVFRRLQFAIEDAIRYYRAAYLDDLRAQAKDATDARREEIEDAENRARFFGLDCKLDSLGFSFVSIVRPRSTEP